MDVPINIPVKRHVYKFLIKHFGDSYRITTYDFLGVFLYNLLRKQSNEDCVKQGFNIANYPLSYQVIIPEDYFFCRLVTGSTDKTIIQLNEFIDSLMDLCFLSSTEARLDPAKNKKEAYEKFVEDYDLDECDKSYDALKKAHYRFKKSNRPLAFISLS